MPFFIHLYDTYDDDRMMNSDHRGLISAHSTMITRLLYVLFCNMLLLPLFAPPPPDCVIKSD